MRARFIIGYILLAFGILGSIWMASVFIALILAPPVGGGILAGLGAGFAWLSYLGSSILFIIPGAILVRKHKSFVRKVVGIIVILLGIIPQAVAYLHALPRGPAGPLIEHLAFFFIPLTLYLIPGILLILPAR
jgi:putative effector of murein hydrolase LrgA (UPF0299 family)